MPIEIRDLMQQVRRLRVVPSRHIEERISGDYRSVFKGHGIEFDDVREYAYGDDIRDIDWNVTARMGHPYIKRYREERELTLILMVDVSGSLAFGARSRIKEDTAATLAGLLALSADRNHDKTGLILFSDRVEKYVPPARGRRTVMRILRDILAAEKTGRRTDIGVALRFLNRVHKRRAAVFLISDFLDAGYENDFPSCARRHDLIACRLNDSSERILPSIGLLEVVDPENGDTRLLDTSASHTQTRLREWADEQDRRLSRVCRRYRTDRIELSNESSVADALHALFRQRRHRMLCGQFPRRNAATGIGE